MKEIIERGWPLGWIPSHSEKGNFDPNNRGLLKMDNITQEEMGHLRISKSIVKIATSAIFQRDLVAIFSTSLPGWNKKRYVYDGATIFSTSDQAAISFNNHLAAATASRISFIAQFGEVFILCGTTQFIDNGITIYNLGIPTPTAPVLVVNTPTFINLSNLDGSNKFTNWAGIEDATYDNSTNLWITITPNATTYRAVFQTVFGGTIDTTNFSGINTDTTEDIFSFDFYISDVDQLNYVKIEFYNEDPTLGVGTPVIDYFFKEWDFQGATDEFTKPFNATSGQTFSVQWPRSYFTQVATTTGKNWTNIKAIRFTVGLLQAGVTVSWNSLRVTGGTTGPLQGEFQYSVVEVRDDGNYLEFSPMSTPVSITANSPSSIKVDRSGAAVNSASGANEIWYFRYDDTTGQWLFILKDGPNAVGFTPTFFNDFHTDAFLTAQAASNPDQYILNTYRTALPSNVIQGMWYASRFIYLTPIGFFPTIFSDPGSYDSRFYYEIAGNTGNNEMCLFMIKINTGTFIVATNRDFYMITGDFSLITDPNSGQTIQNVNIQAMGISDPPISRAFSEFEGTLFYISATGPRFLINSTSYSINDDLELLFRGEPRYDLSPIRLAPNDTAQYAVVSSGKRIYWSFPHYDGYNRVYILNVENPANLYTPGERTWRLLTIGDSRSNPITFFREEDGNILCGAFGNNLPGVSDKYGNPICYLERDFDYLPVKFKTQWNYGDNPNTRKDSVNFKMLVNTNNNMMNLAIYGMDLNGDIYKVLLSFVAQRLAILEVDLKANDGFNNFLPPCVAFMVEIAGYTNFFELEYFSLNYEERPEATTRALMLSNNFDKSNRKRIALLPFRCDTLGNIISSNVIIDGVAQTTQTFQNKDNIVHTFSWQGNQDIDQFGTDFQHEITCAEVIDNINSGLPGQMEFERFLPPVIAEERPNAVSIAIQPATNFNLAGRKIIGAWPFICDSLNQILQIICKADGIIQSTQIVGGLGTSGIKTYEYIPPNGLEALDWELRVISDTGLFEFLKFMDPPLVVQEFPTRSSYAIMPFTNFGNPAPKKITTWPFIVNSLNNQCTIKVTVDGAVLPLEYFNCNEITTINWYNNQDILGIDWQIEVYETNGTNLMEFYKFLPPIIVQNFPVAKEWDQIGPLDLRLKGIIFKSRIRIYPKGSRINYTLFDSDSQVDSGIIITTPNQDNAYIITFPIGINSAVLRLVLTSGDGNIFYRMGCDFLVRQTGAETEEQWIKT